MYIIDICIVMYGKEFIHKKCNYAYVLLFSLEQKGKQCDGY